MPLTPRSLNAYLKAKNSPMAGLGGFIIRTSNRYGIDPGLLVGISGIESSFGTAGPGPSLNNYWGWMGNQGGLMRFPNKRAAISHVAKNLASNYVGQGLKTPAQIATKYAPEGATNDPRGMNNNERWAHVVSSVMTDLGAPAAAPTRTVATARKRKPALVQQAVKGAPVTVKDLDGIVRQFGFKSFAQAFGMDDTGQIAGLLKAAFANNPKVPKVGAAQIPVVSTARTAKNPLVQRVVEMADDYLGVPYQWGAKGPTRFDCSGFIQYLYKKVGVDPGGYTQPQWQNGRAVGRKDLQPGDAVFFRMGTHPETGEYGPQHVGLYLGSGLFIHAPKTGDVVKISRMDERSDFAGARRYI